MHNATYNDDFFDLQVRGALQSARVVAPILLNLIKPTSVIDVGCGRCAWLRAFQENGVKVVKGLDGPYIDPPKLLIHPSFFYAVDLSKAFEIDGQYDLAVCLEVAEHIPEANSQILIRALTQAAPLILFSAAIPGQGGTGHVNEQWPSYWRSLFDERGFRMLDPIRRHIWQDTRVEWWYRQNILLYASSAAIAQSTTLQAEEKLATCADLEYIHTAILSRYTTPSLRFILRQVPQAVYRGIKNRLLSKT